MSSRSVTTSIYRAVAANFRQLKPYQGSGLIKSDVGHFLEGLTIERTPYKGTYYVWSLICLPWHVGPYLKLDYSTRLENSRYFKGTTIDMVDEILTAVQIK